MQKWNHGKFRHLPSWSKKKHFGAKISFPGQICPSVGDDETQFLGDESLGEVTKSHLPRIVPFLYHLNCQIVDGV
jgi:hypothetical protein